MSESVILLTLRVNGNLVEYFSFLKVVEITSLSLSNEHRREAQGQLDFDCFVGFFLLLVQRFIECSLDTKEVFQDVYTC